MKHIARILSLALLVSGTLFIASCGGDDGDGPSAKEKQVDLLVGTWSAQSVTNDGDSDPHTANYSNFKITITKSSSEAMTYVTQGRPAGKLSPWNANGTLSFGTNISSELKRGDNVTINYSLSGGTLTLTLPDYSGEGYLVPGKTETVEGDWVFVMTK